ncbi:hypothetical protein [Mycolicibacterium sp. XJ775]
MKRKAAHGMRRAARVLIGWSTKLDPPAPGPVVNMEFSGTAEELGRRLAERAIKYGNEAARAYTSGFLNR